MTTKKEQQQEKCTCQECTWMPGHYGSYVYICMNCKKIHDMEVTIDELEKDDDNRHM